MDSEYLALHMLGTEQIYEVVSAHLAFYMYALTDGPIKTLLHVFYKSNEPVAWLNVARFFYLLFGNSSSKGHGKVE